MRQQVSDKEVRLCNERIVHKHTKKDIKTVRNVNIFTRKEIWGGMVNISKHIYVLTLEICHVFVKHLLQLLFLMCSKEKNPNK